MTLRHMERENERSPICKLGAKIFGMKNKYDVSNIGGNYNDNSSIVRYTIIPENYDSGIKIAHNRTNFEKNNQLLYVAF